jgi:O-6-methylguanine DNA methyltransferase
MCDIILVGDEMGLHFIHLETGDGKRRFAVDKKWKYNNDFFKETIREIEEYFQGKRKRFTIKLSPMGTNYQKMVWKELTGISYGKLNTYKEIAEKMGNPKAARAVGMANSKNPIPIVIPCHRVVGVSGKLTGFAYGLEIKEKLINFEKMITIYNELLKYYGYRKWWPAKTDYEMMVGAILTQNTTWKNVEKAIDNLGDNLNPADILNMKNKVLSLLIKPSGYYNQKSTKLKALTRWYEGYKFNIELLKQKDIKNLRKELLKIHGVGRETADSILTYALKKPSFVIDTYTRRLFKRLGFIVPKDYDDFKNMIEGSIKSDLELYGEYHALIVEHAKNFCSKNPRCKGCPLEIYCEKNI